MDYNDFKIIALSSTPWHGPWMNRQQILSRLAKRNFQIVYSNGALCVWDLRNKKVRNTKLCTKIFEYKNNIKLISPGKLMFRWPRFKIWDDFAIKRHLEVMNQAANESKLTSKKILYIFNPSFYPYVAHSNIDNIVYHVYDAYSLQGGWSTELADKERALVKSAKVVFAVTQQMADLLPAEAQNKTYVVPNGADVDFFSHAASFKCPDDLEKIPKPRVGYTGNITPKIDLNFVAEVANKRPDWHWVFIGHLMLRSNNQWKDEYSRIGFEKCNQLKNVHFLGEKEPSELPAYMGHMDVNTMCYRSQGKGWWIAGYPLKLHEYLAVGKPVVSADIEAVRPFSHVCDIAESCEDWIVALERGLSGGVGTEELRRQVASENSWDKRVDTIEKIIYQIF